MDASPAKFLFGFLFASIILWSIFVFASSMLAWILSRAMGASVSFRVGGWKCLRDVVVKFNKGAVESVSIGEIRLSIRQSLVKLGVGFMSRDPKLQVLICDLEVVMRAPSKISKKARSRKSRKSGRGKWMVVANMARFLSVSVTELVVKTPKATMEVKELTLDLSKDGGSKPELFVKLLLAPIFVHFGESRVSCDQSSMHGGSLPSNHTLLGMTERVSAPFSCEEFSIMCEFGHDREAGVVVRNMDIATSDVSINLNEELLLKRKGEDAFSSTDIAEKVVNESGTAVKPVKKSANLAVMKYASMFPEKLSFVLPKLDMKFVHREVGLMVENNIMGIQLKGTKTRSFEDVGESTRVDVQMEFSEIHLLKDGVISVVEILKLDVVSSVYIPLQPALPIRSEVDVKLGGTQCNLVIARLHPWMQLHALRKRKMVLRGESSTREKSPSSDHKAFMWTSTISAPEMTVVLYDLDDSPLYHGCSQSSHVFANNISSTGTVVHMELGEFNLNLSDEYRECLKESLFGVETNMGSLIYIAKVSLDWGKKDMDPPEDSLKYKTVLFIDVTGMGVHLTFRRIGSLMSTALSFKHLLKSLSGSGKKPHNRVTKSSKPSAKGIQLIKFNLERCSLNVCGEVGLENSVVPDHKRANYGSQGGRIVISVSADGTPRTATIRSTAPIELKKLKYSVSLDIFHLSLSMNKEKKSTQMELERARSIYQEHLESSNLHGARITLLDMQNAKFVRRSGGLKEIAVCSLFSATDISVRWEPDVHIALFELGLHLKLLLHNQKLQELAKGDRKDNGPGTETSMESVPLEKHKKRESIFAIDVEMLHMAAEVGDGVETTVQVQSIFSENARIGVLLEGLMLNFNNAKVFRSSRMQVSRIPNASGSASTAKHEIGTAWDWVIQALDVHICMPYRLELRAIDDSVEEMLRALKLVTAAKTKLLFPNKEEKPKAKSTNASKIGRVRFCIKKLTADIEEQPIQGWLDEHYQLLKKEACELAVRLNFIDELIAKGTKSLGVAEKSDSLEDGKVHFNGEDIDVDDASAIQNLREEIYKQSFRSYYQACQNLVQSEGSGACSEGFQGGFKPSTARSSLFSISATELDVSLTRIEGGDFGMIEILQKLDPVCRAHSIPFSRLYGGNINLQTGSLAVRIRNYTFPLFAATSGRCEGRVILAQQATCFQPQIHQNVYIGRWRKVHLLRSASGTTPPMKTYSDLPLHFQKAEISYGVGFEPALADISYAFTVALRRANLSIRNPSPDPPLPKKEKSLPWWDEMRNYIHGNTSLYFSESQWNILASTDPYEKSDKLQIRSGYMELQQSDGRVYCFAKNFKILVSSLDSLLKNSNLKRPSGFSCTFIEAPAFSLEVIMEWECDSGNPLNHYLFAFPSEGVPREKVYDPFRSTSLSLWWNLWLRPSLPIHDNQSSLCSVGDQGALDAAGCGAMKSDSLSVSPTLKLGPHDLAWILKFWSLNYNPPHKLRSFSRWPRFGIPRVPRSGNLSLDKVMTEFMFRVDATPACIRHMPLDDDDPAKGLTFSMNKLKYELYYGRGKQKYTFESKRDALDLVYQGLDLHMPKAFINRDDDSSVAKVVKMPRKTSQSASTERSCNDKTSSMSSSMERQRDDGFLLSSEYFTIRRQAPKADPDRLLAWQEAGRRNLEMTYVRSEFENGSESDDHTRSDPSDDDGYNVVIADNCQRIFVYGLKLLWTLENRDAVWSWVGGISKAFESPKPSPSRQYAQRKLLEDSEVIDRTELPQDDNQKSSVSHSASSSSPQHARPSKAQVESPPSSEVKVETLPSSSTAKLANIEDCEGEGTRHFMVNVIEPQFNLHSEDANGRFLLAAVSGRVLARSFHSVLSIGYEVIEQALGGGNVQIRESQPEMTWNRMEYSVMLEHVQAHVAPTDVDPGAGLQWLPKIRRSSPKVKRTGALLERVFMPCDMYFRYTRHKGATADLKVKPLKELSFNSHNITATMTSRQFQVMLDVLTNLLFARLPKPRKVSLPYPAGDDEDIEEEADEVVPDGVEEVELARVNLEQKERAQKLIQDDIRKLSLYNDAYVDRNPVKEGDLWIISGGRSILVQRLKKELVNAQKSRKVASASLRMALQKAAQLRLMEKEKNKSPSCAMRISLQINKVVWSMLVDGRSFAEAEINDMIYDFDRDYKDVGVAKFTTKYFVVRNCLPNAKSDMLLSAWNPPTEWGKKVMLRVDAKQGAPKDGNYPLELFQVEIYPLKIHLTETMYRMMWEYFFPEEEQDSQRRQEVWKFSTTAGSRRAKKGSSIQEAPVLSNHLTKDPQVCPKSSNSALPVTSASQFPSSGDSSQVSKLQNLKANIVCGSTPELRRTSSFDRTWEENVAESVTDELMLQMHSSSFTSSTSEPFAGIEQPDEVNRNKSKESKLIKSGRSSHEEKKVGKALDEKKSRPRRMREFHNIKISQVELLVTYEGSRFAVSDLRLLMDTFHRVEFTGTWRRLFSRVKKHIIWGVLKSVTGMQGKKFKDKAHNQREAGAAGVPDIDLNLSDSDGGSAGKSEQNPLSWPKRPPEGAGDGFVTSIKGLFNSQRRKAKAFVLRTMRGEAENEIPGDWSESEAEFSPFARQLTITKAKKLIRRHTKKFRSRGPKGLSSQQRESLPSSPRETTPFESDSSNESSPYEDFHE